VPAGALQVAAVLRTGEAAVSDPHHPAELPGAQVVFDLADQLGVALVARPAPHPDRDRGPRDSHPDDDLRQIGPVVLAVPVCPERRRHDLTVLVGDGLVGRLALKIGRRRVKEQQVDLEVQQIRGGEVHLLGELVVDFKQPVHRAVAGILREP